MLFFACHLLLSRGKSKRVDKLVDSVLFSDEKSCPELRLNKAIIL